LNFLGVKAHEGHLAVQRCTILDENHYIRTVLLLTRLRITLLTTRHLWVLAKGAGKIKDMTASKISQLRHDATEAKFHKNVDFAAVKRSFWMKNGREEFPRPNPPPSERGGRG
jgi:hypothetical protein